MSGEEASTFPQEGASKGRRLSPYAFAGKSNVVAGGVLDEVHGLVGPAQDLLGSAAVDGEGGYSEAGGNADVQPFFGEVNLRIHQVLDALHYRQRVPLRSLGEKDHELVASVTEGVVDHAEVALDNVANHPEQSRADEVAVGVVHLLEVIEIDEDHGKLIPVAGGPVDFSIEHEVQMAGVIERSAIVRNRQLVDPLDVTRVLEGDRRVVRQVFQYGDIVLPKTALPHKVDKFNHAQDFFPALDGDTDH